jgi:hypothetical protein
MVPLWPHVSLTTRQWRLFTTLGWQITHNTI